MLSQEPFVAQTPEQARLLLDLAYAPALAVLIGKEASAGEVAQVTTNSVKQVHHRLTRLVSAGLIEVIGERARGGRPIKLYRAVSAAYRVPMALTAAATVEEWLEGMQRPFLSAFRRAVSDTYRLDEDNVLQIVLDDHQHLHMSLATHGSPTSHRRGYGLVRNATLNPAAIQELKRRLNELNDWVTAQEDGGHPEATPCILALLFTPGQVEES